MSTDHWFEKEIKEMLCLIAKTRSTQEVELIFEKVLTPREINDIARRLKIVEMLNDGYSYGMIRQEMRASNTLIGRLSIHEGYGFRRSAAKSKRAEIAKTVSTSIKNYKRSKKLRYKGVPGIIPISKT